MGFVFRKIKGVVSSSWKCTRMVDEEDLSGRVEDGILDCIVGDHSEYYIKDESLDGIKIEGKPSNSVSLLIENCNIDDITIIDVENVEIKNTSISDLGFRLSYFIDVKNLTIDNCLINSESSPGTTQESDSGTIMTGCDSVTIENTRFSGNFEHAIIVNNCNIVLREIIFQNIMCVLSPDEGTKIELYDLEFESVEEIISNGDYSITRIEGCPEVVLDKL